MWTAPFYPFLKGEVWASLKCLRLCLIQVQLQQLSLYRWCHLASRLQPRPPAPPPPLQRNQKQRSPRSSRMSRASSTRSPAPSTTRSRRKEPGARARSSGVPRLLFLMNTLPHSNSLYSWRTSNRKQRHSRLFHRLLPLRWRAPGRHRPHRSRSHREAPRRTWVDRGHPLWSAPVPQHTQGGSPHRAARADLST